MSVLLVLMQPGVIVSSDDTLFFPELPTNQVYPVFYAEDWEEYENDVLPGEWDDGQSPKHPYEVDLYYLRGKRRRFNHFRKHVR